LPPDDRLVAMPEVMPLATGGKMPRNVIWYRHDPRA
jgi:hypothetical protein